MFLRFLLPVVLVSFATGAAYQPVKEYDPGRDAVKDIRDAVAEAARTHRRVLLDVGGNWCSWCRLLDKFFADHPDLAALIDKNYVMVKVNYSPDNNNEEALGKYPHAEGYPHIYVLDSTGKLAISQSTDVFEDGQGYNAARWKAFLEKWAPPVE
jgi:thioredoxin-related protein